MEGALYGGEQAAGLGFSLEMQRVRELGFSLWNTADEGAGASMGERVALYSV